MFKIERIQSGAFIFVLIFYNVKKKYGDWVVGIGDLDNQTSQLSSYDIIPSQTPLSFFFSFFFSVIKNILKKSTRIFIHFHFCLITFRRDKKFSWFKDIIDLGPFCDFSVPSSSPYLLSPLCHKGEKMPKNPIHFGKVISSSRGSNPNPSDIWCAALVDAQI